MRVLEMEEVESLVGNSNRKKLKEISRKPSSFDWVAVCAQNGAFIWKLIVGICVIGLALIYRSASVDDAPSIPTLAPSVKAVLPTSPPPTESPTQKPVEEAFPDTEKPTENPTQKPVSLPPTEHPTTKVVDEQEDKNTANDPFLYSKYATVLPLADHPLPDEATKDALKEKWGKWKFYDGDEDARPMEDYAGKYPHRDIPGDDFPNDAWQADAVYVNHILNDADGIISRAMEAIFTEYGHAKPLPPEGLAERMKMFHWSKEDLSVQNAKAPPKYQKRGDRGNGGWTTKRSFDGLVRRLLHAMMTQDTFTVVLAGHSAAKGEGNHFRQSYMMEFHKVMYPIFARLGVKLITRNMAQGGMGTLHNGMGSGFIYGDEIDLLLWDSGMTESDPAFVDVFFRQALLAGNRVPVLWGGPFELLRMLHEEADVDVGEFGLAMDGIPEVESREQAMEVPWAARYLKCSDDAQDVCQEEPRFCAKCWIDRPDGVTPKADQRDAPRGQVKWHPGWRHHQLVGRNLAFAILEALQSACNTWMENVMGGPPLDDDYWHVTAYYENIRNKIRALEHGACFKNMGRIPTRMCNIPMKARTQYTPRANPSESALTTIVQPTSDGHVLKNEKTLLYEGPDVHNECFDIPEEGTDVFQIVTGRRELQEDNYFERPPVLAASNEGQPSTRRELNDDDSKITPGKGWEVWGEPPGVCDGTYNATCGRWTEDECVMIGHHDAKGALVGNEYSGWLVMKLEDLKEGIIVMKLHTWHTPSESTITQGWTSVNNERQRRLGQQTKSETRSKPNMNRQLVRNYGTPELPDNFIFEYAIDGQITSLDKEHFLAKKQDLQSRVETLTMLDDPEFTSEAKDVEVAIRLRGSGDSVVFGVSHVYWA